MRKSSLLLTLFCTLAFGAVLPAQTVDTLIFEEIGEFEYDGFFSCYTATFDALSRPYLFTSNKELGFIIFDIQNPVNPIPIDTFLPADLGNLKVTNHMQIGNVIYVSLGGFQGLGTQNPGLAILDITDPANSSILGLWKGLDYQKGSAIVFADGGYAYLGAMDEGLIILDVSDPEDIQFVSDLLPDPNFPMPPGLFSVPHVRGIDKKGDIVYLCYDAGGLRAVDVSDKSMPIEIGKYVNADLDSVAAIAYNNVVIVDDLAYVAVDYCGLDIVDISDPTQMNTVGWLDPWGCNTTNWNGRPGHTNQVGYSNSTSYLFVSGADTEVLVYSLTDPEAPVLIGQFGEYLDNFATWGVGFSDSHVALALLDNPSGLPYMANYGGIKILSYQTITALSKPIYPEHTIKIYPNPTTNSVALQIPMTEAGEVSVQVWDQLGRPVLEKNEVALPLGLARIPLNLGALTPGLYWVQLTVKGTSSFQALLKQ